MGYLANGRTGKQSGLLHAAWAQWFSLELLRTEFIKWNPVIASCLCSQSGELGFEGRRGRRGAAPCGCALQTHPKPRLTPFNFLFTSRPYCAWENQPCWENQDGSRSLSQGGVLKEVEDTVARAHGSIKGGVRLEMNKAL